MYISRFTSFCNVTLIKGQGPKRWSIKFLKLRVFIWFHLCFKFKFGLVFWYIYIYIYILFKNHKSSPLEGECLTKEIVYQATITTKDTTETYIGLTASEFKTRWRNHKTSFTHEKRKNDTELTKYLWQLKDKQEEYSIAWRIVAKAKPYSNHTKRCNLCTAEKHLIITKPFKANLK